MYLTRLRYRGVFWVGHGVFIVCREVAIRMMGPMAGEWPWGLIIRRRCWCRKSMIHGSMVKIMRCGRLMLMCLWAQWIKALVEVWTLLIVWRDHRSGRLHGRNCLVASLRMMKNAHRGGSRRYRGRPIIRRHRAAQRRKLWKRELWCRPSWTDHFLGSQRDRTAVLINRYAIVRMLFEVCILWVVFMSRHAW
jgi:hypothetical protein